VPASDPLCDFDPAVRTRALRALAGAAPPAAAPRGGGAGVRANLHLHTFHSYNCQNWSPARAVCEAWREGWAAVGIADFDTLAGLEETFEAADLLGVRAAVSLETRVFWPAYADRVVNSPGEPGVAYLGLAGFAARPAAGSRARAALDSLSAGAEARTRLIAARVNAALPEIAVDYDRDARPLTPSGNVTERHLLAAYDARARGVFGGGMGAGGALAAFWGRVLGLPAPEAAGLLPDPGAFRNAARAKLMKRGGPGYIAPEPGAFPPLAEAVELARGAGALPCAMWLDGQSAGEADAEAYFGDCQDAGLRAACFIPDRNWNVPDPARRKANLAALARAVEAARSRGFLLISGTEMNSPGQRTSDDPGRPELAPYLSDFLEGAYALHGHSLLSRARGWGIGGAWAAGAFGRDRRGENAFFGAVGRHPPPDPGRRRRLAALPDRAAPEDALAVLGAPPD